MGRRKTGLAEDIFTLIAAAPWWLGVVQCQRRQIERRCALNVQGVAAHVEGLHPGYREARGSERDIAQEGQRVVAAAAVDHVSGEFAARGLDRIVAGASADAVGPGASTHCVIAGAAVDDVFPMHA
jgi:hypothetical protein